LRYWGEAFSYAVHIRSLFATTGLDGIVRYKAWTGHKPDVSHLQVFSLLGWAHVPRQVRRGKLESQAVKVQMLGWWVDKAKGYCLEDLENSKLIASQDIRFFKDDSSSNLASIKVQDTPANNQDVNTLVNNAIQKGITPLPIQKDDTFLKESPSPLAIPPFNDAEINSPTKVSRPDEVPNLPFLPAPRRSRRKQKTPSCFALTAIDNITTLGNVNFAFIAIAEEPKTHQEAIHFPYSKQWEQAIKSEFTQLQKLGIFEVVNGLPKGQKAMGSHIVFHEKRDGHANLIKFKAHIVAKDFS